MIVTDGGGCDDKSDRWEHSKPDKSAVTDIDK